MLCSITCTLPNTHTHTPTNTQTHWPVELGSREDIRRCIFYLSTVYSAKSFWLSGRENQVFPLNGTEFRRHSDLFVYRLFTGDRSEGYALVLLDGLEPCELCTFAASTKVKNNNKLLCLWLYKRIPPMTFLILLLVHHSSQAPLWHLSDSSMNITVLADISSWRSWRAFAFLYGKVE